jgi:hypothetical protein
MTFVAGNASASRGVIVSDDFRDNLIIDKYDPVFTDMRASKLKHLRSANSEDAVTWNVFRSLWQLAPRHWLPALWSKAFPNESDLEDLSATVELWVSVAPPIGLLADGDEGLSEVDVIIQAPTWVWFIEAKYRSDISLGTTTRPDRDQLIRNIDVGSYYAGVRKFYFSLLVMSDKHSRAGVNRLAEYSNFEVVRERLRRHRPDGLTNLKAISSLTWNDLASVLKSARSSSANSYERDYAERALGWLQQKRIEPAD